MDDTQKKIIDWTIIEKSINNNWFESNPKVTDEEISHLAIDVSADVDIFIRKKIIELKTKLENEVVLSDSYKDSIFRLIDNTFEYPK